MLDELLLSGQDDIQIIVFRLGCEDYAVPITNVQEIIIYQEITRVPEAPSFIQGIINLRGTIIPIIDGKKKFNIYSDSDTDLDDRRIIIFDLQKETIGLIVDSVTEVIHLNIKNIEHPPIDITSETEYLWGVGKYSNKLLVLLNPDKFLSIEESGSLQSLSDVVNTIKQSKETMLVQN